MATIHTATAGCNKCDWRMTQSGVNVVEIGKFLRANLVAHVEQAHPGTPINVEHVIIEDDEKAAEGEDK